MLRSDALYLCTLLAVGITDGANSFAWNADADEGANAWDLGDDPKADQYPEYDDVEVDSVGDEENVAADDAAEESASTESVEETA